MNILHMGLHNVKTVETLHILNETKPRKNCDD